MGAGSGAVLELEAAQRLVAAAPEHHAAAAKTRVFADFPTAAVDDDRGRAIVEAVGGEVGDRPIRCEHPAAGALVLVERDLRECLAGVEQGRCGDEWPEGGGDIHGISS